MLRVQLLGELEARVDGRVVGAPASRRAWSLLAWLALYPGEHPRGALATRFWPNVLERNARASLRSAIWALHRALGPADADALVCGGDRIGLRCRTDLAEFDALCAADRLQDAVALCRGPLLAAFDEDWVLEARDEHAERVGEVLARLAAGATPGRAAVTWARRRLALDPLNEDAARDLMRRLAEAGERAGALAVHDRLVARLRALGLAPSAQTRAVVAALRDAEGDRAPAMPIAPHDGIPWIGRDAELTALLAVWAQVRTGTGALVLVDGEAGIGKSRLAAELVARARAQGAYTAHGTAIDLGRGAPPFGLWGEVLADLARELEPPPADVSWPEELARLTPSLPRRLGRAPAVPPAVAPDLARARLLEATVELIEHATATRPVILVFDDAHRADAATLELAAYLSRRITGLPVLLLLTRRLAPRRDAIDALVHAARGRGITVEEVELGPLDRTAVERLIGTVATLAASDRESVLAAADGNPLLALESARAAGRGPDGEPAHPPTALRAAVRAAIAGLSTPARRLAELAAIAGRDLTHTELAALAEPDAILDALDCDLFRRTNGHFGFRHALLRDAVCADLSDAQRAVLDGLLGQVLTGHAAESARDLRPAGRDDEAAQQLAATGAP